MDRKALIPLAIVASGTLLLLTGCNKHEAEAPAATPPESNTLPTPAPKTTKAPAAINAAAVDTQLAESQAALKARNYEAATTALISYQRARLNEQQAAAAAAQMRQLQSSLADAVAAGDPRAQAAAARLRQAAMAR